MSLRYWAASRAVAALVNRKREFTVEQLRRAAGPPPRHLDSVRGVDFRDGELGGRACEIGEPRGAAGGDLLFVHGGGWVAGTPAHFRKLAGFVAREAGLRSHAISYSLAPEHPFPAGVEDALAAYRDLLERGADPRTLVLAGESAGGGLALGALLLARDAGLPMPAAAVLWWPGVDLTLSGESVRRNRGRDLLTPEFVRMCAEAYLAGADPRDPLASPLFADLGGLPPTYLQVGSRDLIADDSVRLAARLRESGVEVELDMVGGKLHGFAATGDGLPDSRVALARVAAWLKPRLPGYERGLIRSSRPST